MQKTGVQFWGFRMALALLVVASAGLPGCGAPSADEPKPAPGLVQLPPVEPALIEPPAISPKAPPTAQATVEASARPVAYACLTDHLCQDEPGVCPVCKKPFTAVAIANPDPAACPVTGDPARSTKSAVIGGKVYFFCCGDCIEIMQRDPAKVLEAAEQRAKAKP